MNRRAHELSERARNLRDEGGLHRAGDIYTAAAHEYAGCVTEHVFPDPDNTRSALSSLLRAVTCYRIVGDEFRTQNRCDLGILLAEDYIEYIERQEFEAGSFADLRRGAWPEYIGDLRTIARRDDADETYDRARDIYESAGDFEFALGEQEHMQLAAFFRDLRWGLGHDIPEDAIEQQALGPTFTEWLDYKRDWLPDLLDQLEARGEWPRS